MTTKERILEAEGYSYTAGMRDGTKAAERIFATIAQTTGGEMNDELTIIANVLDMLVTTTAADDPLRYEMIDAYCAAQRMARQAAGLLAYGAAPKAKAVAA